MMAINEEYPILEYLILGPLIWNQTVLGYTNTVLVLSKTLQALHLHHLALSNFALPIQPLQATHILHSTSPPVSGHNRKPQV